MRKTTKSNKSIFFNGLLPLIVLLSLIFNPLKVNAEIAETEINGEFINSPFISVSATFADTFNGFKIKDNIKNKGNIPLKKIFLFDFVIFFIFRIHQCI